MADNINKNRKYLYFLLIAVLSYQQFADDFFRVKEEIIENFNRKILGIYLNTSFEIDNLGYTSNIYAYESWEQGDYTLDYQFNIHTAMILKDKFIIKIDEHPSYSYYVESEENRGFFNRFALSLYSYIGRLNINYTFRNNSTYTVPTDEFGIRLKRDESGHLVSFDYGHMNHFYINLFFRSQNLAYKDLLYLNTFNLSTLMNRKEYTVGLSVNKRIFTSTRFSFGIDYFKHNFIYSADRDSRGVNTYFAIAFRNRGQLTGNLRFGFRYFDSKNILYKSYLMPFGFGQINFRLLNRLTLIANYLLDISYSFTGRDTFYQNNAVSFGFNYRLNRELRLEFITRFGILHYRYLTCGFKHREDHISNQRVIIRYIFSPELQIGASLNRLKSDSTNFFYNRDTAILGIFLRLNL